ncbi:MAG: hypothetical protein QOC59_1404, partial [Microbacteriaceae bacterium]|nr:hypothetical protein [Microbacteriaceae bacterium]
MPLVTSHALPSSSPAAQGVDSAGIGRFLDVLESDPSIEPHGVMLLRHGHVIAEGWWRPFEPDRLHLLYSLSKTFTVTALGFAIAEGLVALDDRVVDHFPEFAAEITGERSRAMRVRDVAAMASGHAGEMLDVAVSTDPEEPVRGFLLHEPESEPGTRFAYNQPATYSVAAIVQRAAGTSLAEYLRPRLLDPLGIGPVAWQQHPDGRDIGFSGLHATTAAIAALGQLYLQDGRWEGRQLLPEGWAEQVRTKRVETAPTQTNPDWMQGYGYQVWRSRHGYRGDGAFGQYCLILPEQDAVVAITESTDEMQAVLDAVWEHLLPAFRDEPLDGSGDEALAARLAGLELPETGGASRPPAGEEWAGRYEPIGVPALEAVELAADGDRWTATLMAGADRVTVPVGRPGWHVVEGEDGVAPVAASGGW